MYINIFMYIYILYISKICIYLHICIDMGVPRWEWADEGGCTDGNTAFGCDSDKNALVFIYMF